MKWLILLFSIFKPMLSTGDSTTMMSPITEFKDMIKANAVKIIIIFATASALATIFASGVIITAVDIGAQYDQNAYVYFSSMIAMGLTLALLPIVIGAITIRIFQNDDRKAREREVLTNIGTAHPLQDALALLVHDFVKERELKRTAEESNLARPRYTESSTEMKSETSFAPEAPRH